MCVCVCKVVEVWRTSMGALLEMLGVDRRQVTDSASDCHAVRASPYDGAGSPHYIRSV